MKVITLKMASIASLGKRSKSAKMLIMKILVFGAGAVGGYFGGLMCAAGLDADFVARVPRAHNGSRS